MTSGLFYNRGLAKGATNNNASAFAASLVNAPIEVSAPRTRNSHNSHNALYPLSRGCSFAFPAYAPHHVGLGRWLLCSRFGVLPSFWAARQIRPHVARHF